MSVQRAIHLDKIYGLAFALCTPGLAPVCRHPGLPVSQLIFRTMCSLRACGSARQGRQRQAIRASEAADAFATGSIAAWDNPINAAGHETVVFVRMLWRGHAEVEEIE